MDSVRACPYPHEVTSIPLLPSGNRSRLIPFGMYGAWLSLQRGPGASEHDSFRGIRTLSGDDADQGGCFHSSLHLCPASVDCGTHVLWGMRMGLLVWKPLLALPPELRFLGRTLLQRLLLEWLSSGNSRGAVSLSWRLSGRLPWRLSGTGGADRLSSPKESCGGLALPHYWRASWILPISIPVT